MLDKIKWLGHATFKVNAEKVIYFDPWKLKKGAELADVILISHDHYDHCVPEDVAKIQKKDTVIVTPPDCAVKLKGNIREVKPGDKIVANGIPVEVVPAYNLKKSFHPKSNNWVGFIVTASGKRIYHPGDTDFIPEMKKLKVDIALMPIGGTYAMDASDAARAVEVLKPEVAIPMHYGDIVGTNSDAEKFKKESKVEVRILTPEK